MDPAFQLQQNRYQTHLHGAVVPDSAAGSTGGASTLFALPGSQREQDPLASAKSPLPDALEPDPDPVLDL